MNAHHIRNRVVAVGTAAILVALIGVDPTSGPTAFGTEAGGLDTLESRKANFDQVAQALDPEEPTVPQMLVAPPWPSPTDADIAQSPGSLPEGGETTTESGSFAVAEAAEVPPPAAAATVQGDWGATSLAPSAAWGTSGATGAFTWSYPLQLPDVPGGVAPDLAISYSSAASDGRTAATNNQASWIGEGFDLAAGFVERRYVPCAEDRDPVGGAVANNATVPTGDLCWSADNATLVLNGSAVELVKDAVTGQWRGKNDDGARVEHLTSPSEQWVVTTVDGTKYFFGSEKRPTGSDPLESVWSVPVFGNHPGEPCYASSFATAKCTQPWRWNLDHVLDPSGSTITYHYHRDSAAYRQGTGTAAATYNPGGYLERIEYGTHTSVQAPAPAVIEFDVTTRCKQTTGVDCSPENLLDNKAAWPDAPVELYCEAGSTTCEDHQRVPVFFDRYRLRTITTKTYTGTAYVPVDSWTLDQTFLAPNGSGDGEGIAEILWLESITHTGRGGTTVTGDDLTLPSVVFTPVQLKNRVDSPTDGPLPMWRPRISAIRTESGGQTTVTYRTECSASTLPTDPRTNTRLCFPVSWDPEGHTKDAPDWFHKYVVEAIVDNGAPKAASGEHLVTGSDSVLTTYAYGDGGAAWVKPTGALVKPKEVTYSDFRGFSEVTTTVGGGDERSSSRTRYFRGLGGQLTAGPTGHAVSFTDQDRFTGQPYSVEQLNGAKVVSQTVTVPSNLLTTATAKNGTKATVIGTTTAYGFTFRQDGTLEHRTQTATVFDRNAQVTTVHDAGDVSLVSDDICTRITYAHESTSVFVTAHKVALPARVETVDARCAASPQRPADVVSDTLTTYDAEGRVRQTWNVKPDLDRTSGTLDPATRVGYAMTAEVLSYDARGRATQVKDALGRVTTTAFEHSGGGLLAKQAVTSPDPDGAGPLTGFTSTTSFNPLMGTVLSTQDPNGRTTSATYDALGRLLDVRHPDRQGATIPSIAYAYKVRDDGLSSVVTRKIGADGQTQHVSSVFYDGLMRTFQTQVESADGGGGHDDDAATRGRVVTHTFYDTAGRVRKTTGQWWATGAPSDQPVAAPLTTPSATTMVYDGAGRLTDEILWDGTESNTEHERWRTVTDHDGAYTTVVPPAGGTARTTVTDARGRATGLWEHLARPAVTKGTAGVSSTLVGFDARTLTAGAVQRTSYEYDGAGRMARMSDPAGNAWTYGYDFAGRQVRATDPDAGTTSKVYDAAGQLTSVTNGLGKTLSYTYDGLGRKTRMLEGGVTRATWTYDTAKDSTGRALLGLPATSSRWVGSAEYRTSVGRYDTAYRPVSTTLTLPAVNDLASLTSRNFTTSYAYTADGQVRSVTLPEVKTGTAVDVHTVLGEETVTTYFDSASRPRWMAGGFGWGTYVAESRFTAFGQPLLMDLGNSYGSVVSYRHDEATGRLMGVGLDREQVNGSDLAVSYRYDDAGNVVEVADAPTNPARVALGTVVDNQCFAYDGLRRLTSAWTAKVKSDCALAPGQVRPDLVGGAAPYWTEYEYDALGNRTALVEHAVDGSAGVRRTTYAHGAGVAGPHAVTSMSTSVNGGAPVVAATFGYDAAGNQTSRAVGTAPSALLGWDAEGELAQVVTSGAGNTEESTFEEGEAGFVYDANGDRLVRRDAGGTTVYLPGGQELHVDTAGVVSASRYYAFAGQVVAVRTGPGLGSVTSLVNDPHGTTLVAVPNTRWTETSVIRSYTGPFGGVRGQGGDVPGDKQFLGKTRDEATGLTLLGARYYDELVGRFISVDPLLIPADPQQWHAYAYANNNPLTYTDPLGLAPMSHDGGCKDIGVCQRTTRQVNASRVGKVSCEALYGTCSKPMSTKDKWINAAAGAHDLASGDQSRYHRATVNMLANGQPHDFANIDYQSEAYRQGQGLAFLLTLGGGPALKGASAGISKIGQLIARLTPRGGAAAANTGTARFVVNSAGDVLDTTRVSIPAGKFDYLLKNPSKSGVFSDSMGFDQAGLDSALRSHLTGNFGSASPSVPMVGGGTKFTVRGPMTGPSGQTWDITTAWGVDPNGTIRLITATP